MNQQPPNKALHLTAYSPLVPRSLAAAVEEYQALKQEARAQLRPEKKARDGVIVAGLARSFRAE